ILLEHASERRVRVPFFLAGFNGNANVPLFSEAKTEHRVGDEGRAPVHQEQVNSVQPAQVVRPVIVADIVIGLGSVIAIPPVMDRDAITVSFSSAFMTIQSSSPRQCCASRLGSLWRLADTPVAACPS